jgi:hypothetical protein
MHGVFFSFPKKRLGVSKCSPLSNAHGSIPLYDAVEKGYHRKSHIRDVKIQEEKAGRKGRRHSLDL